MNVLGVNTRDRSSYVSAYFGEYLTDYRIDGRKSTCYSETVSDWLDKFGIERGTYTIRDLYSTRNHAPINAFSYAVIEMHNEEDIVILKLAYNEYRKTKTKS